MDIEFDKKGYNREYDGYKSYYYAYAAIKKNEETKTENRTTYYNTIINNNKDHYRKDKYKKMIKKIHIQIINTKKNEIKEEYLYRIIEEIETIEKIMK